MKTLILVRHAKSSWADADMDDIDRPLNDRGKKDAPEMAKRLKEKDLGIDVFVSSPAKRARKTAKFFVREFDLSKEDIILEEKLYEPTVQSLYQTVEQLNDQSKVAVLFSHNPGITEFVNTLTSVQIDDIPTCGIFALQAQTDSWTDFRNSEKNFLFFDYPKNHG